MVSGDQLGCSGLNLQAYDVGEKMEDDGKRQERPLSPFFGYYRFSFDFVAVILNINLVKLSGLHGHELKRVKKKNSDSNSSSQAIETLPYARIHT